MTLSQRLTPTTLPLTVPEQMQREITRARKKRDAAAVVYYSQRTHVAACVSWETFQDSWAGENWRKENAERIAALAAEWRRLGY